MNNEINPQDTGVSVYGMRQMAYTLNGSDKPLDFGAVVTDAAMKQAVSIQENAQVVASAVKMRSRKIEDLGKILALVAEALGGFSSKDPQSTDTVDVKIADQNGQNLKKLQEDIKRYGVDVQLGVGTKEVKDGCSTKKVEDTSVITLQRGVAMKAQSAVQQMIDKEDNNLQQDKVTLQGFISKADKAYETAGDLTNKFTDSAGKIIQNM